MAEARKLPLSQRLVANASAGVEQADWPPTAPEQQLQEEHELLRRRIDGIVLLMAGGANTIMQLGWPEVGHGVVESKVPSGSVMEHPFKRFRTTISFLAVATLGDENTRAGFREAVNSAHRQVRSGPDSPVKYNAFNRDLQLWVAACLYYGARDALARMHGPFTDAEEEILLRASSRLGTTLQVPADMWFQDREAFENYWQAGLDRVRIDPEVRDYLMRVLEVRMLPFPLDLVSRIPMRWLNIGFLPPEFRGAMGLAWSERDERAHALLLRSLGRVMRPLPHVVRMFPVNYYLYDVRRRIAKGKRIV